VVFLDADYTDHPEEIEKLIAPIAENLTDLVIGSRTLREESRRALSWQQRWGNRLATKLVGWWFGYRFTDLGPFRAIRRDALESLCMRDRGYGWTVEMQVKAACAGLRAQELPILYWPRIGRSKISGTPLGALRTGTKILYTIAKCALQYQPCRARMLSRSAAES
jgi:glycosyl transferase family 2